MASYIAIIDVGHGNSTVLKDGDNVFIVDCGSKGTSLLQFLKTEKIKDIEYIFLSHADQDHIGGLVKLISSDILTIKNIHVNTDASKGSALWKALAYELSQQSEANKLNFKIGITRSDGPFLCGGIELTVTGPSPFLAAMGAGGRDKRNRLISSNAISASFHVRWEDAKVAYLTGDIDHISLDDMKDHNAVFEADLLVFPHHGGLSDNADAIAFAKELCQLTRANTVIFSIGRNKFDNPRPEIVEAVRQEIPKVRISCTQLSKNCASKAHTISPVHLHSFFAKGRVDNECCGGTFVIDLDDKMRYLPDKNSHEAFIDAVAQTPMCRAVPIVFAKED